MPEIRFLMTLALAEGRISNWREMLKLTDAEVQILQVYTKH